MAEDTAPVQPDEVKLDAQELHNASFEEILDGKLNEAPTTDTPTNETPPDTGTVDQKADTTPVTPAKTEPAPDATPPLDVEKLKGDLKQELSQETAQRVVEALTGESKEGKETYPWEKEKRNPSYKEALDYVKTKAKEEILADLTREAEEEETREREQQTQRAEQEQKTTQAWHTYWNEQLTELEADKKIPVLNPEDTRVDDKGVPLDPGRRARYQLFSTMQKVSQDMQKKGKAPILNIKEIYAFHYRSPEDQPPGADAPVAGVRKSVGAGNPEQLDYVRDVRNNSFEDILSGK